MDSDAITADLIVKTLRAWQQGQTPPPALLGLDLLRDAAPSAVEGRDLRLRDLLLQMTTDELERARRAEDVRPPSTIATRRTLLSDIAGDFAHGKAELQAWSALYHRYLAPVEYLSLIHIYYRLSHRLRPGSSSHR